MIRTSSSLRRLHNKFGTSNRSILSLGTTTPTTRSITTSSIRSFALAQQQCTKYPMSNSINNVRYFSTNPAVETREFRAETKQLLDIVTHSIYTDKEVFLRELISNASDSLEKYRYKQVMGEIAPTAHDVPLEINITTDKTNKILTISDNGIGMSKDDLINNLGIIARSGSKQFVQNLSPTAASTSETHSTTGTASTVNAGHGIIGQFGVGFYSSFMVSDKVTVESIPAQINSTTASTDSSDNSATGHRWVSDGTGSFTIEESPTVPDALLQTGNHGSLITMQLKATCMEYANDTIIKEIVKKYSNFVAFPIKLNGETINLVSALWTQDKRNIAPAQYTEFYKFVSNSYEEPRFHLHFRTDAPIDLKVLFFVPQFHTEKFGQGRMEPAVNLYSRKVLIESKPKDLLPDWLRFVKGVVDSEDLPLSLSREKPQDSKLLVRIKEVVTRKLLKFFEEQLKTDVTKYQEFYNEFSFFLKEGICADPKFSEQISKLLMFQSSTMKQGEMTTFDEYIARCPPEQKEIYYIVAPSHSAALQSPYMETFQKHNKEVLLLYSTIDDFVMSNLKTYGGRKLVSAEKADIDFGSSATTSADNKDTKSDTKAADTSSTDEDNKSTDSSSSVTASSAIKLTDTQATEVCNWLKYALGKDRVLEVKLTNRLSDSPAIVTDHESGSLRKMIKMVEHSAHSASGAMEKLPPQVLEINPKHPIILGLYRVLDSTRTPARTAAIQQLLEKKDKKGSAASATSTAGGAGSNEVRDTKNAMAERLRAKAIANKLKKQQESMGNTDASSATADSSSLEKNIDGTYDAEVLVSTTIGANVTETTTEATTATVTATTAPMEPAVSTLTKEEQAQLQSVENMAKLVAEQVYDNALIAAGLVDDPRTMLSRLNRILQAAIPTTTSASATKTTTAAGEKQ